MIAAAPRPGPSPLSPLPPHSPRPGEGNAHRGFLPLGLPLLPVGGSAVGEEGRGDEGSHGATPPLIRQSRISLSPCKLLEPGRFKMVLSASIVPLVSDAIS